MRLATQIRSVPSTYTRLRTTLALFDRHPFQLTRTQPRRFRRFPVPDTRARRKQMALDRHEIASLAGPKLLGYFFNWGLLGVLTMQTYLYHINFPRDPVKLQCLVYGLLAIEWAQTGLITYVAFDVFVYNFGDTESLTKIYYGWLLVDVMCAIVSVTVQLFFVWRIYVLARSPFIAGVITVLSLLQGSAGITLGLLLKDTQSSTAHIAASRPEAIALNIWAIGSTVVDDLIAFTMTLLMLRMRRGAKLINTEKTINKIIRVVIETGTLTASVAIVTLILCVRLQGTLYYDTPIYIITKLYANTFLANLVSRAFRDSSHQNATIQPLSIELRNTTSETVANSRTQDAALAVATVRGLERHISDTDGMHNHEMKKTPLDLIEAAEE